MVTVLRGVVKDDTAGRPEFFSGTDAPHNEKEGPKKKGQEIGFYSTLVEVRYYDYAGRTSYSLSTNVSGWYAALAGGGGESAELRVGRVVYNLAKIRRQSLRAGM